MVENVEPIKRDQKLVIALIFSGVIIIALVAFILLQEGNKEKSDKQSSSSEITSSSETNSSSDKASSSTSNENEENEKVTNEYNIAEICKRAVKDEICKIDVNLAGKKEELRLVSKVNDFNPYSYDYRTLTLNDFVITNAEERIGKITIIDDVFVIDYFCINCGGNSAALPNTLIMDPKGNIIARVDEFVKDETGFQFEKYSVNNNELVVTMSSVGYFGDEEPSVDCYLKNITTGISTFGEAKSVNGTNYDKYANIISKIEYRIAYLGDNKFSTVKSKEYKFSDLYTKTYCIEEYARLEEEINNYFY